MREVSENGSQHPRKWRLVGVAVSTTDSESVDRGSNPRRAFELVKLEESHMSLATNFFYAIQKKIQLLLSTGLSQGGL